MRKKLVTSLIAIGLVAGSAFLTSPVSALDQSAKPIKLSLEQREASQSYPLMATANPGFRWTDPRDCTPSTFCDWTIFDINDVPDGVITKITLTTTFEHAEGANDLDIYLIGRVETRYKSKDPNTGVETTDIVESFPVAASAATGSQPEIMKLVELRSTREITEDEVTQADKADYPNAYHKEQQIMEYLFEINLFTGATAYEIKGELAPVTLPTRRGRTDSGGLFRRPDEPSGSRSSTPDLSSLPSEQGEVVELDPVKKPGADGPLSEHDLVVLGGQSDEQNTNSSLPMLIWIATSIVVLGAGSAGFFYIKAKRAQAET